jgi:hypothetical protein
MLRQARQRRSKRDRVRAGAGNVELDRVVIGLLGVFDRLS